MDSKIVLWDDVPVEQRQHERPDPVWGCRVQHRGCAAAVAWPDGQGYHRCATQALRAHGLCRRHAERAEIIPATPRSEFPRGLDNRIGNVIRRNLNRSRCGERRTPAMTVGEFRQISSSDLKDWRNAGRQTWPVIQDIQTTWSDDELIRAFELRASPWDASGDVAVCNWVGEAAG